MLRLILRAAGVLALTTGVAEAQFAHDTIKIGVLNDRSGLYADLGGEGSAVAARLAAEVFGGKIEGKPIVIVTADHQNKADLAASIARQWIDVDGVEAIADVPNSAAALAVQEVTKEKGRILLISGAVASTLTGTACSPTGFHWTIDTHALAVGTGRTLVKAGGDTWFFLTADYAFGKALEDDTTKIVQGMGGRVLGGVRAPLNTADFSSFLLQAQSSGAKVIGLANAGGDTTNSIKQAHEFGIIEGGQKLAALLLFLTDVDALGLDVAKGLVLTTGFYWDLDDQTRAWSAKFEKVAGRKPTMAQAGVYSAVRHYLQAVKDLGTDNGPKVAEKMRATPVNDMFAKNGRILKSGRMVHDVYLAQVKAPAESRARWDDYKILETIPGDVAFLKEEESGCPLVKP